MARYSAAFVFKSMEIHVEVDLRVGKTLKFDANIANMVPKSNTCWSFSQTELILQQKHESQHLGGRVCSKSVAKRRFRR